MVIVEECGVCRNNFSLHAVKVCQRQVYYPQHGAKSFSRPPHCTSCSALISPLSLSSSLRHPHLPDPPLVWTMNNSGFHPETPQPSNTQPAGNTQDLTMQEGPSTCKCTFMWTDLPLDCMIDACDLPCQCGI